MNDELIDILVENCDIDMGRESVTSELLAYRLGQATMLLLANKYDPEASDEV